MNHAKFLAAERCQIEKPQNIESMIDSHDNEVAAARQVGAGGVRRIGRPIGEAAAVKPHHDRALAGHSLTSE